MSWISGERIFRMLVGLVVTTVLARELGPDGFGTLSIAIVAVSLFAPLSGYWLIGENLERLELYRTLSGAAINVVLNLLFIPKFGIFGAALATVLAQSWSGLWFDLCHPATRISFRLKMRALLFKAVSIDS